MKLIVKISVMVNVFALFLQRASGGRDKARLTRAGRGVAVAVDQALRVVA